MFCRALYVDKLLAKPGYKERKLAARRKRPKVPSGAKRSKQLGG